MAAPKKICASNSTARLGTMRIAAKETMSVANAVTSQRKR